MSKPERRTALIRLAQELRQEREGVWRTLQDAATLQAEPEVEPGSTWRRYAAGAILHAFYTGVEKVFLRLVPVLNGGVPEGPAWHRHLLSNMTLDLPGVRPPLLRPETAAALAPYLGFRHRFRNLYAFDLDWFKLLELLHGLPAVAARLEADLAAFLDWLDEAARALQDE